MVMKTVHIYASGQPYFGFSFKKALEALDQVRVAFLP